MCDFGKTAERYSVWHWGFGWWTMPHIEWLVTSLTFIMKHSMWKSNETPFQVAPPVLWVSTVQFHSLYHDFPIKCSSDQKICVVLYLNAEQHFISFTGSLHTHYGKSLALIYIIKNVTPLSNMIIIDWLWRSQHSKNVHQQSVVDLNSSGNNALTCSDA